MFKKMTVLAIAVGVVAALALPASASADWKHEGSNITSNKTLKFTGQARFQGGLGGVECQVTSAILLEPGTTGRVETFVPHPTSDTVNCKGLGGLAFCQIHNVTPTGLPSHGGAGWIIHTSGPTTISITTGEIHSTTTGGFCATERITLTGGTVTATVDAHKVSTIQLSGTLQEAHLQTRGQCNGQQSMGEVPPNCTHKFDGNVDTEQVTVSGQLHVEAPDVATYEI